MCTLISRIIYSVAIESRPTQNLSISGALRQIASLKTRSSDEVRETTAKTQAMQVAVEE
jgi:hypothetical protein